MVKDHKNLFFKSFILLILPIIIGIPINSIINFTILLFFITILIFSKIKFEINIFYIISIVLISLIIKYTIPNLKIQEQHNIVILNNNSYSFYESNLPNEIFTFFKNKFIFYHDNSKCVDTSEHCWKNFNPYLKNSKYPSMDEVSAFSSDWSFSKNKYSRIVNNFNFTNLKSAKIGIINNLSTNFIGPKTFDIARETVPFFVKYEISKALLDSSICWKGNIFWESNKSSYNHIFHSEYSCKDINEADIDKSIYAISFGKNNSFEYLNYLYGDSFANSENDIFKKFLTDNELIIKLDKNLDLKIYEYTELFLTIFTLLLIFITIFLFNKKIYIFSILYLISFLLLLNYVDNDLFNGFDIFTAGNDGVVYMSYGNVIFQNLINLNFYEFFKGVEAIFYFPSSIRYFWSINKIFFGESFYGYILISYLYIFILYFILLNIINAKWALAISLLVFFTRIFEGYALSLYKFIKHIAEGDAEPLSIFFFLTSLLIFINLIKNKNKLNNFYSFSFGFLLFLSVSLRPNFSPTALLLIISYSIYTFIFSQDIKKYFWSLFGFSFILLIPIHNYSYGNSFVLFSSGSHHNTHASIFMYYNVFIDFLSFDLDNSQYASIIYQQFIRWLKPFEIHYILSFFIIIISLIIKNNFLIRVLCFLALSQHVVLLIFEPTGRYSYLAWILTLLISLNLINRSFDFTKTYFKKNFINYYN